MARASPAMRAISASASAEMSSLLNRPRRRPHRGRVHFFRDSLVQLPGGPLQIVRRASMARDARMFWVISVPLITRVEPSGLRRATGATLRATGAAVLTLRQSRRLGRGEDHGRRHGRAVLDSMGGQRHAVAIGECHHGRFLWISPHHADREAVRRSGMRARKRASRSVQAAASCGAKPGQKFSARMMPERR